MEFVKQRWGGPPHDHYVVTPFGEDEHGLWCFAKAGTDVYRGDDVLYVANADSMMLFPSSAWWVVSFHPLHPSVAVYVNIGTPAVHETERLITTDLDLDVVVRPDGTVEIEDRDKFARHQEMYDYPPEVIEKAESATAEAFELASAHSPPFDGVAADRWMERARIGRVGMDA